jgi:hypothetical protein
MSATFDGVTLTYYAFDPNPVNLIPKLETIDRTGIDGAEVKKFGDRPQTFTCRSIIAGANHAAVDTALDTLKAKVGVVGTLAYEGENFTSVLLSGFVPGRRRTVNGPSIAAVQYVELTFQKVQT